MRAQTVRCFGLALRFITVDDLCSSELDSLLPKIGSELSDKEKFEPQDHARAYGSKWIKSTSAHMDDKDKQTLSKT